MNSSPTFHAVTGLQSGDELARILMHRRPVPATVPVIRDLITQLSGLLHLTRKETAAQLGLSLAVAGQREPPNIDTLDRLYALCTVFDQARAVFGDDAPGWLAAQHPALDHLRPLDLQRTRYGEHQLCALLQAMLDGAFL